MTISEVAKKYDLTADTLRYYERIGLLPTIGRNSSGIRNYSENDCTWVEYIKCMRSAGVSIETLAEYVNLFGGGEKTIPARKKLLMEQRKHIISKIEGMNAALQRLDKKLENYEERTAQFENNLK